MSINLAIPTLPGVVPEKIITGAGVFLLATELRPRVKQTTRRWLIQAADGSILGEVRFFGAWRCYVLAPTSAAFFDKYCLRAIADFCDRKSAEWRESWRKK
jgi:hypothetical protein